MGRKRDDAGFSLIELMAAITILAVGVIALVSTTDASFGVAGASSRRSKGVGIATKAVEDLRAVPYDSLNASSGNVTTSTTVVDGVAFRVEQTVTWAPSNQYKAGLVSVPWTDRAGAHEVHQSTYVYPGGIGPAVITSSTTSAPVHCTPVAPTLLVATPPLDTTQASTVVDLTWSAASLACDIETFVIQYSTNDFATQNEVTRSATANTYRVTGLSAGMSYKFRVAAKSAALRQSSWSTVASIATSISLQPACQIGTLTVTPAAVNKKNASAGSGIESNPAVALSTTGVCSGGFYALYRPTAATERTATLTGSANGQYTGTLLGTTITWEVGRRYVDIKRASDNALIGSILVTVCEHNVSRCT